MPPHPTRGSLLIVTITIFVTPVIMGAPVASVAASVARPRGGPPTPSAVATATFATAPTTAAMAAVAVPTWPCSWTIA
jgi:hypothetical protein